MKVIGPSFGEHRFERGIQADNGSIYCGPSGCEEPFYFLKISPMEGGDADIKLLQFKIKLVGYISWSEGVLAEDGCLYYTVSF